jgi:hypothetical protein
VPHHQAHIIYGFLLWFTVQALALDEEVPDKAELEDDTEPDVLGMSRHRTTLVGAAAALLLPLRLAVAAVSSAAHHCC